MGAERWRQAALGAVLVVLAIVLYRAVAPFGTTSGAPASSSNSRARAARAAESSPPATAPDVRLRTLDEERPKPAPGERNLFRFRTPPPPPRRAIEPPAVRSAPAAPAGTSPTAPIPLKFIGIVEAPAQAKRIAALVDSAGYTYHGAEGGIVAGQYRVLKIGIESIEMAYLDGRGRQTIRLTGS